MFIKDLFENKHPKELQGEFLKFGRGEFRNKYLVDAKRQKDRMIIKTGSEFANYLVRKCLSEVKDKEIKVTGAIISTINLSEEELGFSIKGKKNFMGIKQLLVDDLIDPKKIIALIEKYPRVFFALSFISPLSELKIKAKAPKSAKPSTSGDKEVSADFCSLKTTNKEIIETLLFDCAEGKEIKINHTLKIENIVYPKDEKDPIKIRENSKRAGEIIGIIDVDGKHQEKIVKFSAQ